MCMEGAAGSVFLLSVLLAFGGIFLVLIVIVMQECGMLSSAALNLVETFLGAILYEMS